MYPPGWDEEKIRRVLKHYERQMEEEAVAEDEAAYENSTRAIMEVPKEFVSTIRKLIAKAQAVKRGLTRRLTRFRVSVITLARLRDLTSWFD